MNEEDRVLKTAVNHDPQPVGIIGMVGHYQVKVTRGDGRVEWYNSRL